ncbi:MAG: hypothetical protein ACQETI_09590 [Halobacteriota archaeon]
MTRERLVEWVPASRPDDECDREADAELRAAKIDRRTDTNLSAEETEGRIARAHDRLLYHLDTDRIRAYPQRVDGRDEDSQ